MALKMDPQNRPIHIGEKLWIKFIIRINFNFIGYLYIMD
jgi:hypothetical protein